MAFSPVDIILLLLAAAGGGLAGYLLGCRQTRRAITLAARARSSGDAVASAPIAPPPESPAEPFQGGSTVEASRSRDTLSTPPAYTDEPDPEPAGLDPAREAGSLLQGANELPVAPGESRAGVDGEPAPESAGTRPADPLVPDAGSVGGPPVPADEPVRKPPRKPRTRTGREVAPPAAHAGTDAPSKAADDLKRITGIGPRLELRLNALGITRLAQMAAWTPEDMGRVGEAIGAAGRPSREDWAEQARALLAGAKTGDRVRDSRRETPDQTPPSEAPALLFPELTDKPPARRRRSR